MCACIQCETVETHPKWNTSSACVFCWLATTSFRLSPPVSTKRSTPWNLKYIAVLKIVICKADVIPFRYGHVSNIHVKYQGYGYTCTFSSHPKRWVEDRPAMAWRHGYGPPLLTCLWINQQVYACIYEFIRVVTVDLYIFCLNSIVWI